MNRGATSASIIEWREPLKPQDLVKEARELRRGALRLLTAGLLLNAVLFWWLGELLRLTLPPERFPMLVISAVAFQAMFPVVMLLAAWRLPRQKARPGRLIKVTERGIQTDPQAYTPWKYYKARQLLREDDQIELALIRRNGFVRTFRVPAELSDDIFAAVGTKLPAYDANIYGPTHRDAELKRWMVASLIVSAAPVVAALWWWNGPLLATVSALPRQHRTEIALAGLVALCSIVPVSWMLMLRPRLNPTQRIVARAVAVFAVICCCVLAMAAPASRVIDDTVKMLRSVPPEVRLRYLETVNKPCRCQNDADLASRHEHVA